MTVVCTGCSEKRAHRDVLIHDDYSSCKTCFKFYHSENDKKNSKKLEECDIFTLHVKSVRKNNYSFVEWGRAKELGKVLVVIYDMKPNDKKWTKFDPNLFKYLMNDSKQSFKTLSTEIRNSIISLQKNSEFTNYKEYKQYLKSYLSNN